jgi:hypothetical protein
VIRVHVNIRSSLLAVHPNAWDGNPDDTGRPAITPKFAAVALAVSSSGMTATAQGHGWFAAMRQISGTLRGGDAWLTEARSAVMRVPSVLVPHSWNVPVEPFGFEPRLWRPLAGEN